MFACDSFSIYIQQRNEFDSIFSATDGYRITLDELTDGGHFTCHAKHDTNAEFDIHFQISMDCKFEGNVSFHVIFHSVIFSFFFLWIVLHEVAGTKFVNKPILSSKTDGYAIEGDTLELDCTVEAQLGAIFDIKWLLPNNNISEQVRTVHHIEIKQKVSSFLWFSM